MRTGFPVTDEAILALKVKLLRELAAAQYPREALGSIAMKHEITVDDARALVLQHGWPERSAMGRAAEVLARTSDALEIAAVSMNGAPTPTATVTVPTQPKPSSPGNSTEQMISDAEKSKKARTRRLATKIRKDLAELRGLVIAERKEAEAAQVQAEQKARLEAEVAELELELAQKKAALRPTPRPKPAKPRSNDSKKIRAWAAEHGVDCEAFGRIPAEVVAAYKLANPSEGDA